MSMLPLLCSAETSGSVCGGIRDSPMVALPVLFVLGPMVVLAVLFAERAVAVEWSVPMLLILFGRYRFQGSERPEAIFLVLFGRVYCWRLCSIGTSGSFNGSLEEKPVAVFGSDWCSVKVVLLKVVWVAACDQC